MAEGKKKATAELDFSKTTKRYMRFDASDDKEIIQNLYVKMGAIEVDEETEMVKVTVEVVKRKDS